MSWQTKLHDKQQEIKMLTDAYENKLKSMQAELDETYQMVKESG